MKLQLTSFQNGLSDKTRLELTSRIINNSTADLILFSGHTIGFVNEMEDLRIALKNTKTEVVFELESINSGKINNCLYHIKNGKINNLYTNQIFTQSGEIESNYELGDRLINELETKRIFEINGLNFLIIQCGEMNILKNIQNENNRVEFRLLDDKKLTNRFKQIIKGTDVILNPIHTPMGNQGKIQKRREFLSAKSKYYFSTSNTKENSSNLNLKSLQYAFFNGKEMADIEEIMTENSVSRIYEINDNR